MNTKNLDELMAELMDFVRSLAHENGYQFKQVGKFAADLALDELGVYHFAVRIDPNDDMRGSGRHFSAYFRFGRYQASKILYAGTKEQLRDYLTSSF